MEETSSSNEEVDVSAIIAEVAREHKVIIAEDDPIIHTVLLNRAIHEAYAKKLNIAMEKVVDELKGIYHEQEAEAEKVVTSAMERCLASAVNDISSAAQKAAFDVKDILEREVRHTRYITLLCALVALASMVTTLLVMGG